MPTNTVVGSARAIFTISLVAAATEEVRVDWATKDGTALAGRDYETNSGTVAFAPGETSKTVEIFVHGRTVETEDRVFYVLLDPPVNALLADEIGACVIHVDTTGTVPVVTVIIPRGEKGLTGDSAYQIALNNGFVGTEAEWLASLRPSPAEIAPLVAPLINAGDMNVTAEGTETMARPDTDNLKGFAGRIAYMSATKKAAAPPMTAGVNVIPVSAFVGDAFDPGAIAGFQVIGLRAGAMVPLNWEFLYASNEIRITGAQAGDTPLALQQDIGAGKVGMQPVSIAGTVNVISEWLTLLKQHDDDLKVPADPTKGAYMVGGAQRVIYASELGCVAGTDVWADLTEAATIADYLHCELVMDIRTEGPGPDCSLSQPFLTPQRFNGNGCDFDGIVITRYRKDAHVRYFTCNEYRAEAIWRSNIHNIVHRGDFVVAGYDEQWGVFYSDFRYIVGDGQQRLEVDKQAVNGNSFTCCGGHGPGQWGLLITDKGATTSLGIMEAHGNTWYNSDYSHSMGAYNAIAVRNHTNHLFFCYFEHGAQIVGKWNAVGCVIDGQSPPLVGVFNHVFATTDVSPATMGDSFSANLTNICHGGDWSIRRKNGVPPGFGASFDAAVIAVGKTPYGYTGVYGGTPVGAYHYLDVKVNSETGFFSAVVVLYCPTGELPFAITITDGVNPDSSRTPGNVVNIGDGFYLYRISGTVEKNTPAVIRFGVTNGSGQVRNVRLGAAFVSAHKATFMPYYANPVSAETTQVGGMEMKRGIKGVSYVSGATFIDITITYGESFRSGLQTIPSWVVKPGAKFEGKHTKTELLSASGTGFVMRLYYGIDWSGEIYWKTETL